ncbi:MAG: hypothetical protein RL329_905 [Bacteroidota bacterium]|jgi:uncharacterized protein (TIGR02646 family)
MEQIIKPIVTAIPILSDLANHYVQWGQDFALFLQSGGKSSKFTFERKKGLYPKMRNQLALITKDHCSFCDTYPVGDKSKETIEHYYPKSDYPLLAYDWNNLFYCCDRCQSEANKTAFTATLKPDDLDYQFSNYFYFDLQSGEIKVFEDLERTNLIDFEKATNFLKRYGINHPKRNSARIALYKDIRNHFIAKKITGDERIRDDFMYRYVYDFYLEINNL